MKENNPLLDLLFLRELDSYRNRIIYARITSLTLDAYPIERIEGVVSDGSITIDGTSAVRRVCSLTMTTKNVNLNNVYWGVSSRVKIEVGLAKNFEASITDIQATNLVEKYKDYPDIIWFPLGVYLLTDFKTSQQVNNYVITLTGKDKMCLLNGDIGGVFNAETDLGQEQVEQEDGSYKKIYRSIPYIIKEMIHQYAQEPFHNIVIKDIDDLALEVLKNNSGHDIYLAKDIETQEVIEVINSEPEEGEYTPQDYVDYDDVTKIIDFTNLTNFIFDYAVDEDDTSLIDEDQYDRATKLKKVVRNDNGKIIDSTTCTIIQIRDGEDIGYQHRELTYPKDLIAGIGETVTSVLDKIVQQFGDYEYFYNIEGQFVFQAKQVYINSLWHNIIKVDKETYVEPSSVAKKVQYSFEGSALTTAYQNTPNLGKVKNDYTVWGKKHMSNYDIPIHMRYAIDLKPYYYKAFNGVIYITKEFEDVVDNGLNTGAEYREHPLPEYLTDKRSWWHIIDWQNYYASVTEDVPTGPMMDYQAVTNKGFTGDLVFENGNPNDKLIVRFKYPPQDPNDYEEFVVYMRPSPVFIFDVQSSGTYNQYPVRWVGWNNPEHKHNSQLQGILGTAFQHRLGSCGHKYDQFVRWAVNDGYDSYVYQPTIVDKSSIVHEENLLADIVVCDWREIIYQMAKDFYQYNHDDDYYYKLRLNNYAPNLDIILYQNGHTGYEQYYLDIYGFWRQLYIPPDLGYDWHINPLKLSTTADDYNEEGWNKKIYDDPSELLFWFDFFDAESIGLGQFSVPAIGDRPKVINNDAVRAIIYKDIPDVIFIKGSDYLSYEEDGKLFDGYKYMKITNDDDTETSFIYDYMEALHPKFVLSSRSITAQEQIDDLLYNFGYCNENITITSVPIYYLEPNTIISAKDEQRVVNGYYILNKMTIPLKYNGTMQITAIRVPERIK